jgi:hypothetical protein
MGSAEWAANRVGSIERRALIPPYGGIIRVIRVLMDSAILIGDFSETAHVS